MRVLIFNYELPPIGGGAGTATANLARCLAKRGVEVMVLSSRFGALPHREIRDDYTIVRVPVIRRQAFRCTPPEMLTYIAGGLLPSLQVAADWRPDVTCAFHGIPCGPLSLALQARYGIPYVVSLRGGDVPGFLKEELAWMHTLTRPFIRYIWRRAASVVANSPGLAGLAKQSWPEGAIGVIPNGVDVNQFSPPEDRTRPASPVRLLCVGRLVRQKGIGSLIQALARTSAPVALRIVGDGPDRPLLEGLVAEARLGDRIEFAGWVDRSRLADHYQWADAFVLPSLEEGMANAMLEALAAGLAVVTTGVYGNEGLVQAGVNGYQVLPADPDALAAAIDRLASLEPRHLASLGKASRELSLGYTWEAAADQYLELFEAARERR